jgi:hypothetical protein
MPNKRKRKASSARRKVANSEPYEVEYFARKHNISREQAVDLIRKIGNDRDKLNAAAAKVFRK